jgi:hypothetical protein
MANSAPVYIYSEIESGVLTHIVFHVNSDSTNEKSRLDLLDSKNPLQCAYIQLNSEDTFSAHIHPSRLQPQLEINTQECWVVLQGVVEALLYDVNGKLMKTLLLESGSMIFTLAGGHNYKAKEDKTQILEFKSGPYFGPEIDKVVLNENNDYQQGVGAM